MLFSITTFSRKNKIISEFISNGVSEFCVERHIYSHTCNFDVSAYHQKFFQSYLVPFPSGLSVAVNKRQAEFLAGRVAARKTMQYSGFFKSTIPSIPIGKNRAPVWPEGLHGSISHCQTKAYCAVTPIEKNDFIGIDVECYFSDETNSKIENMVFTKEEKLLLLECGVAENVAATLIFSAKESLFKALYPSVGQYFGFECASITDFSMREKYIQLTLGHDFFATNLQNTRYKCNFNLQDYYLTTLVCGSF